MRIVGSPDFQAAIAAAAATWQAVDPQAAEIMETIGTIHQYDNSYKAITLSNGDVYLSNGIVWWPRVGTVLQRDILATYLAHEGAHAFMLGKTVHWNDGQGEALATKYQELIAERLDVPMVYITYPERTVGVAGVMNDAQGWVKIGALAAGALATSVVAGKLSARQQR